MSPGGVPFCEPPYECLSFCGVPLSRALYCTLSIPRKDVAFDQHQQKSQTVRALAVGQAVELSDCSEESST